MIPSESTFLKRTVSLNFNTKKRLILKCLGVCILAICSLSPTIAQTEIDSLERILKRTENTQERQEIQLQLLEHYEDINPKKALQLEAALQKTIDTTDTETYFRFKLAQCHVKWVIASYDRAMELGYEALSIANRSQDSIRLKVLCYNALGKMADDNSQPKLALEFYLKSLRYAELASLEKHIARASAGIGRVYLYLEDYDKATQYYERAISVKLNLKEEDGDLGTYYLNLSSCYDGKGDYQTSLEYLDQAIYLLKENQLYTRLIGLYNNKAYTLFLMNRYKEAESVAEKAIALGDSLSWERELMFAYSTYAEILFAQNRINNAEHYMEKSIALSEKYNDLYLAKYNYDLLYNISLQKEDYKEALHYYQKRSAILDSVNNANARKEIQKLSLEYETEKKNQEIKQLNKQQELNAIALRKSRQLQMAFLLAALLAVAVVLLFWSRQRNKKKADALQNTAMKQEFEKKLADAELQALRAQMNPHFLFNCLNSINSFIVKNNREKASEYLAKFSKLIRQVLNNSKARKISLEQELETLQLYIDMEKLRFSNDFEYVCTLDPNVETAYVEVPPMLFQPYVENSIWHGLMHKKEGVGKLSLQISKDENKLICEIEDNGIGREAAQQLKSKSASSRKSFGMSITEKRLQYSSLNKTMENTVEIIDLTTSEGIPKGTKVRIVLSI